MLSSKNFFYNLVRSTTFVVFIFYSSLTFSKEKFESCENIINKIESNTDLPKGLLTAIGKVESGRFLKNKQYVVWPWTVNHAGKSLFFDTKDQMENYVLKNVRIKDQNIDVGCMQINLKWHKNYFKKINDMLALEPNISYAASFLIQLKNRHGSWDEAIKYYHSSDPKKNKPYLNKVKNFWKTNKQKKYVNRTKKSDKILITDRIKDTQPYLFKRIDKVNFFRKIFAQNK
jgi:hypothetical protein